MKKLTTFCQSFIFDILSRIFPSNKLFAGESKLELISDFESKHVKFARDIIIYLPKSYYKKLNKKYPVIYAHDGQNLFDSRTAFMNNDWKMGKTLDELIDDKIIEEVIVVGIYNTGTERANEYTFSVDKRFRNAEGGDGPKHARFVVEELKPYIDNKYRTLQDKTNTAIMGSSLGAIASLNTAMMYKEIFGKVICMSPSFWWDSRKILQDIDAHTFSPDFKLYIDGGHKEGNKTNLFTTTIADMRAVYYKLLDKGLKNHDNLYYYEDLEATHNEYFWSLRVKYPLIYMFGKFDPSIETMKLYTLPEKVEVGSVVTGFAEIIHPFELPETRICGDFSVDNHEVATVDNKGFLHIKKEGKVRVSFEADNQSAFRKLDVEEDKIVINDSLLGYI